MDTVNGGDHVQVHVAVKVQVHDHVKVSVHVTRARKSVVQSAAYPCFGTHDSVGIRQVPVPVPARSLYGKP